VALIRANGSEELITSIIRVERISELGTSAVTSTLMMEAIRSDEKSVLTTATWRHIPEDGILHLGVFATLSLISEN
jgi:hypothetical protein